MLKQGKCTTQVKRRGFGAEVSISGRPRPHPLLLQPITVWLSQPQDRDPDTLTGNIVLPVSALKAPRARVFLETTPASLMLNITVPVVRAGAELPAVARWAK